MDPDTIVADGQAHPSVYDGTTFSITIEQPRIWKVVRKKDGRTLLTAIWTLGADGKSLTDAFTSIQPNGSASTINLVYRRTAGDSGIPGAWESTSEQINGTFLLEIRPHEANGLTLINSGLKTTTNVTFDGDARWVDRRTFELTDKLNGKVTDTQRLAVSPDGKTLTVTMHLADQKRPNIFVYNRGD